MLFQPSNVTPSTLAGPGNYTVDADFGQATVRFGMNGNSVLKKADLTFYDMEDEETVFMSLNYVSLNRQPRDSAGEQVFCSLTFSPSVTGGVWFENGHNYKYRIDQYYEDGGTEVKVEQLDFNVFYARAVPAVEIADQSITSQQAEITASYTQSDGDKIGWIAWEAYDNDGNCIAETGEMNTQVLELSLDGLENGETYTVKLSGETENGVSFSTSKSFAVSYEVFKTHVGPKCYRCCNTNAVCIEAKKPLVAQYTAFYIKNASAYGSFINLLPVSGDNTAQVQYKFYALYNSTETHKFSIGFHLTMFGLIDSTSTDQTAFEFMLNNVNTSASSEVMGNSIAILGIYNKTEKDFDFYAKIYDETGALSDTVIIQTGVKADPNGSEIEFLCGTDGAVLITDGTAYSCDSSELSVSFSEYHKGWFTMDCANLNAVVSWACLYKDISLGDIYVHGTTAPDINDDNICFVTEAYTSGGESVIACEADTTVTELDSFIESISEKYFKTVYFRREAGKTSWDRLCSDFVITTSNDVSMILDYGAKQNTTYDYSISYIFGFDYETGISEKVFRITTVGWNYIVLEAKLYEDWANGGHTYNILNEYVFALDVEQGAISNNNSPNILKNFTKYPSRQAVSQNYRSGSLSAYIGKVNSQKMCYVDTADQAQAIYDLSTSTYTKFLKTRKGELFMIDTAGETSMTVGNKYKEQPYSASISWVEVGDASKCFIVDTNPTEDDYGELIEAENEYIGDDDSWLWDPLDFDDGSIPEDE